MYKCELEGCKFETAAKRGLSGHMRKHIRLGEYVKGSKLAKGRVDRIGAKTEPSKPQPQLPSPSEIADALLNTAVGAINKEQSLQEQLRVAKRLNVNLTETLAKAEEERDRVIRIHDEQVKSANKHGHALPDTETLMKAARLR